jgi:CIC family chloride channel protein
VLVPIANPKSAQTMIDFAARIARPVNGRLVLLHIGRVPPQTPLTYGRRALQRMRSAIDETDKIAEALELETESIVRLAHEPWRAIVDTVEDHEVAFTVMGWRGRPRIPETAIGSNIDRVLKYANCNVIVVQQGAQIPAQRVLVPVADPSNAPLLLSIGRLSCDESDEQAHVTALHVVPPRLSDARVDARVSTVRQALERPGLFDPEDASVSLDEERIELKISKAADAVRSIADRTRNADVLVLGSSRANWLQRAVVGQTPYRIARRAACPVIMVAPRTPGVQFSTQTFFQFFREEPER